MEEDEDEDAEEDEDAQEDEDVVVEEFQIKPPPQKVFRKKNNQPHTDGVDNIQRLPLDWFTNMRNNYKQNQVVNSKKDNTVTPSNYKK